MTNDEIAKRFAAAISELVDATELSVPSVFDRRPRIILDNICKPEQAASPTVHPEVKRPALSLPEFNPVGSLLVFSENHPLEGAAGKRFLIFEHSENTRQYLALCLNDVIRPDQQNLGQLYQQQNKSCHAKGKLIKVSNGGKNPGRNRRPYIVTVNTIRNFFDKDVTIIGKVILSDSVKFLEKARQGELNPEQTIIAMGFTSFSHEQVSEFYRDSNFCRFVEADESLVFSNAAPEIFYESISMMSYNHDSCGGAAPLNHLH